MAVAGGVGLAAAPPPQAMNTSRPADKANNEMNRFMMSSNNPERYRLIHGDALAMKHLFNPAYVDAKAPFIDDVIEKATVNRVSLTA